MGSTTFCSACGLALHTGPCNQTYLEQKLAKDKGRNLGVELVNYIKQFAQDERHLTIYDLKFLLGDGEVLSELKNLPIKFL